MTCKDALQFFDVTEPVLKHLVYDGPVDIHVAVNHPEFIKAATRIMGHLKGKISSVGTTSPSSLIGVIGQRDRMDSNLQSKIENITTQLIEQ